MQKNSSLTPLFQKREGSALLPFSCQEKGSTNHLATKWTDLVCLPPKGGGGMSFGISLIIYSIKTREINLNRQSGGNDTLNFFAQIGK
jgi:hypothetical protein